MLVMTVFAAYLAVATPNQLVNVFISIFTFYLVATAWLTVRRKNTAVGLAEKIALVVAVLLSAPFVVLSGQLATGMTPLLKSAVPFKGLVLIAIYAFTSILFRRRYCWRAEDRPPPLAHVFGTWLSRRFWLHQRTGAISAGPLPRAHRVPPSPISACGPIYLLADPSAAYGLVQTKRLQRSELNAPSGAPRKSGARRGDGGLRRRPAAELMWSACVHAAGLSLGGRDKPTGGQETGRRVGVRN